MIKRLAVAFALLWLTAAPAPAAEPAPEAGMLLIARPGLTDPRFHQAVVLLVQHDHKGTAGVILNRPSRLAAAEALQDLPLSSGLEGFLSYGGPVSPRAFGILALVIGDPPESSQKVMEHLYLTGPAQFLPWLEKNREPVKYRVFAGYAGWAPGQLAGELSRGDWQLLPADVEMLFSEDIAGLWQDLEAGGESRQP